MISAPLGQCRPKDVTIKLRVELHDDQRSIGNISESLEFFVSPAEPLHQEDAQVDAVGNKHDDVARLAVGLVEVAEERLLEAGAAVVDIGGTFALWKAEEKMAVVGTRAHDVAHGRELLEVPEVLFANAGLVLDAVMHVGFVRRSTIKAGDQIARLSVFVESVGELGALPMCETALDRRLVAVIVAGRNPAIALVVLVQHIQHPAEGLSCPPVRRGVKHYVRIQVLVNIAVVLFQRLAVIALPCELLCEVLDNLRVVHVKQLQQFRTGAPRLLPTIIGQRYEVIGHVLVDGFVLIRHALAMSDQDY